MFDGVNPKTGIVFMLRLHESNIASLASSPPSEASFWIITY